MRIYLIIAVVAMVLGAYWAGRNIARSECVALAANTNTNNILNSVNIQREANENAINTGVGDIRHILYTKYTIAE